MKPEVTETFIPVQQGWWMGASNFITDFLQYLGPCVETGYEHAVRVCLFGDTVCVWHIWMWGIHLRNMVFMELHICLHGKCTSNYRCASLSNISTTNGLHIWWPFSGLPESKCTQISPLRALWNSPTAAAHTPESVPKLPSHCVSEMPFLLLAGCPWKCRMLHWPEITPAGTTCGQWMSGIPACCRPSCSTQCLLGQFLAGRAGSTVRCTSTSRRLASEQQGKHFWCRGMGQFQSALSGFIWSCLPNYTIGWQRALGDVCPSLWQVLPSQAAHVACNNIEMWTLIIFSCSFMSLLV